jgi:transposase
MHLTPGQKGDAPVAGLLIATLPPGSALLADRAYDSDRLRHFLFGRGTTPIIPNNPTRKRMHPFDKESYKARNTVERAIGRLKDWRRVSTRYDKRADTFLSAALLAATIIWWT